MSKEILDGDLRRVAVQALAEHRPSTHETHDVLRSGREGPRSETTPGRRDSPGLCTAVEEDVINLIVRVTGTHHPEDLRVAAIAALGSIRPVTDSALSRLKVLISEEDKAGVRRAAASALNADKTTGRAGV